MDSWGIADGLSSDNIGKIHPIRERVNKLPVHPTVRETSCVAMTPKYVTETAVGSSFVCYLASEISPYFVAIFKMNQYHNENSW